MHRHIGIVIAALIGAAGCAAHGAEAEETRVSAEGQELIVGAFTDQLDPNWWAVEIRPDDTELPSFVISSEDVAGGHADALATIREQFAAELEASGTWYACGIATCPDGALHSCMEQIRRDGCL